MNLKETDDYKHADGSLLIKGSGLAGFNQFIVLKKEIQNEGFQRLCLFFLLRARDAYVETLPRKSEPSWFAPIAQKSKNWPTSDLIATLHR